MRRRTIYVTAPLALVIMFLCVAIVTGNAEAANEIKRDGRFVAYDDGTVLDTKTNLMWAAKDNGKDINWSVATVFRVLNNLGGSFQSEGILC